jgi:ABC-type antimicrobial peptide transport system permease subunit
MMLVVVAPRFEPQTVVSLLRRELAAVNADLPIVQVSTLDTVVGRELAPRRLQTILLAAFAGLALLVALLGLYGVVAFAVASRTREFGIRAAFGATRQALVRLVLADNLRLLLPGLGLGLVGALSLARLMAGLLYGVVPYDPLTFLGATLLLALGALVACWLPTRRATRVDPMVALRAE